jgi:hypothetical protein
MTYYYTSASDLLDDIQHRIIAAIVDETGAWSRRKRL